MLIGLAILQAKTLELDLWNQGNTLLFCGLHSKFNIGVQWDVFEPICFKHVIMIDTVELYVVF